MVSDCVCCWTLPFWDLGERLSKEECSGKSSPLLERGVGLQSWGGGQVLGLLWDEDCLKTAGEGRQGLYRGPLLGSKAA